MSSTRCRHTPRSRRGLVAVGLVLILGCTAHGDDPPLTDPVPAPKDEPESDAPAKAAKSAKSAKSSKARRCSVASCCGSAWVEGIFGGCERIAPPLCGCHCEGPAPKTYSTRKACEEAVAAKAEARAQESDRPDAQQRATQ